MQQLSAVHAKTVMMHDAPDLPVVLICKFTFNVTLALWRAARQSDSQCGFGEEISF